MSELEKARAALEKAGYKVIEFVPTESGGHLYVSDPVQCSSGQRKWTEYRNVRIDGAHAYLTVSRFIEERS